MGTWLSAVVITGGFCLFVWWVVDRVYRGFKEEMLYLRLRVYALEDTVRLMKTKNSKYGDHWWFVEEGKAGLETVEGRARWQRVEDDSMLIQMKEKKIRSKDAADRGTRQAI